MFIANAVYTSTKYKTTRVKICTKDEADSVSELDPDKDVICLRYDHPLSQQIMELAAKKQLPAAFSIHDDQCVLVSYSFRKEKSRAPFTLRKESS